MNLQSSQTLATKDDSKLTTERRRKKGANNADLSSDFRTTAKKQFQTIDDSVKTRDHLNVPSTLRASMPDGAQRYGQASFLSGSPNQNYSPELINQFNPSSHSLISGFGSKNRMKNQRNRKLNQSVDFAHLDSLCRKQGPYALHREGRIRELANLTDLRDGDIEAEILSTIRKGKKKEVDLLEKQSYSRGSYRYYTNNRLREDEVTRMNLTKTKLKLDDPKSDRIRQSLDIQRTSNEKLDSDYKPRVLFTNSSDNQNSKLSALPAIKPLLKKKIQD